MATRKPAPTRIYRVETYDMREGSTYLNSTTQLLNRPSWWPGVSVVRGARAVTHYLEGEIVWTTPLPGAVTGGDDA